MDLIRHSLALRNGIPAGFLTSGYSSYLVHFLLLLLLVFSSFLSLSSLFYILFSQATLLDSPFPSTFFLILYLYILFIFHLSFFFFSYLLCIYFYSAASIVTDVWAGHSGFRFPLKQGILLFSKSLGQFWGPTNPLLNKCRA